MAEATEPRGRVLSRASPGLGVVRWMRYAQGATQEVSCMYVDVAHQRVPRERAKRGAGERTEHEGGGCGEGDREGEKTGSRRGLEHSAAYPQPWQ